MKKTLREFQVKSLCKAISTSAPPETYPGPLQISKMENFATIVNYFKALLLRRCRGPVYNSRFMICLKQARRHRD